MLKKENEMGDSIKIKVLNGVVVQENGIIRVENGLLIGRLESDISFEELENKKENTREIFKKELESLINKHSMENYCDMPDFLMADMICGFIDIIGIRIKKNLDWHGCDSICHPKVNR